jgi:NADH:ubiquinone oxidoreductase subunit 6 (subunit J)
MGPEAALVAIQGALLIAAFLLSLLLRDFVRAILAFALGSALVAGLFAYLRAPFAAVLELTVGAGLTAVLFLVAITLTRGQEGEDG